MSADNCWRCRYANGSHCDAPIDEDEEAPEFEEWVSANCNMRGDLMPPRETPTACPSFSAKPEGV